MASLGSKSPEGRYRPRRYADPVSRFRRRSNGALRGGAHLCIPIEGPKSHQRIVAPCPCVPSWWRLAALWRPEPPSSLAVDPLHTATRAGIGAGLFPVRSRRGGQCRSARPFGPCQRGLSAANGRSPKPRRRPSTFRVRLRFIETRDLSAPVSTACPAANGRSPRPR